MLGNHGSEPCLLCTTYCHLFDSYYVNQSETLCNFILSAKFTRHRRLGKYTKQTPRQTVPGGFR